MTGRGTDKLVLPALSSAHASTVIRECADVTLIVTQGYRIEAGFVSGSIDPNEVADWPGQSLSSIVCEDSQAKIGYLIETDCASEHPQARWRHLNFQLSDGSVLPLNVKFFRAVVSGSGMHLICGRDMRPIEQTQQRFQREIIAIERRTHM